MQATQISFRALTGKGITLDVPFNTTTIAQAKELLSERFGIAPQDMKIILLGKELEDHKTFADYSSTINQVPFLTLAHRPIQRPIIGQQAKDEIILHLNHSSQAIERSPFPPEQKLNWTCELNRIRDEINRNN